MAYRFRPPVGRPEDRGGAPPRYRREDAEGMIIERDVAVPVRDGVTVLADVFRPADERPAPPLVAWSPYGKHAEAQLTQRYPDSGVAPGQLSRYTAFESPDPLFWVPHGYAVVNADIPGTWYSGGDATFLSPEEAAYGHDLIEWAGTRGWSNGKVGMSGVSYLASSQWTIAATRPEHLAAINPWEGWSDTYREVARHGGIPETYFWPYIGQRWGYGTGRVEDLAAETAEHPFFDEFWATKAAVLSRITVPAFVVASWSDQGLHTRGTFEGFKQISSSQKWLDAHGGKKWGYYYSEEGRKRQLEFFDHFLKGLPTSVRSWPRVRYQVRDRGFTGTVKTADDWPPPATTYVPLFLDAQSGRLRRDAPPGEGSVRYESERDSGRGRRRATFDFRFEEAAQLAGNMKLKVWMSTPAADDMDVFIAVQKFDAYGDEVGFPYYAVFENGPVALGWIRASHRELDDKRSTPWQPVLAHRRELKLRPGEIVPLEIEILPSGTRFGPGETLRLVIQGSDIYRYPRPLIQTFHDDLVNKGAHVVHTGGRFDSHLLVPKTYGGLQGGRPPRASTVIAAAARRDISNERSAPTGAAATNHHVRTVGINVPTATTVIPPDRDFRRVIRRVLGAVGLGPGARRRRACRGVAGLGLARAGAGQPAHPRQDRLLVAADPSGPGGVPAVTGVPALPDAAGRRARP